MESKLRAAFNHIESAGANTRVLAERLKTETPFQKVEIIEAIELIAKQLEGAAAAFNGARNTTT